MLFDVDFKRKKVFYIHKYILENYRWYIEKIFFVGFFVVVNFLADMRLFSPQILFLCNEPFIEPFLIRIYVFSRKNGCQILYLDCSILFLTKYLIYLVPCVGILRH